MRPYVNTSAAGMISTSSISKKLVNAGRVLERVRRVDVEEAAAVGAELLDHLLRGDRAHRDRLRQRRVSVCAVR